MNPGTSHLPLRLVVLISGRGSNLEALLKGIAAQTVNAQVAAVISNKEHAKGLQLAQHYGLPSHILSHKDFPSREAFDKKLTEIIDQYTPDLVVLAGFMRILTPEFVEHFTPRLINIHPSLLPSFTGLHTHERALQAGVKAHGCTVHIVTAELDNGPILGQGVIPVFKEDSPETLAERVLHVEHTLFPAIIQSIAQKQWILNEQTWTHSAPSQIHPIAPLGFYSIG
ncbi:MAG: phosphoribosylglycinamide formyltransferase [Pseudomonadota bacterium]